MRVLALLLLSALCVISEQKWPLKNRRFVRNVQDHTAQKSVFESIYELNRKNANVFFGKYSIRDLDIAVTTRRVAPPCPLGVCLWDKSADGLVRVPYTLSSDFRSPDLPLFKTTFNEFAASTCIRFVPRASQADYIHFEDLRGCWSAIGRSGGQQIISLQRSGCLRTGTMAHEMLHSLGLHHEHVRRDRDQYVSVQWNNILTDSRDSFKPVDTNNMKLTSYDYGSIMHYGKAAFSINGFLPTMIAVPNNNTAFGQDFSMSDMDLKKINLLYQCDRYLNVMKNTLAPAVSSTTRKTTGQSTTKRTIATTTTTAKPAAAISSGCGGNLTAPSGVITSPNYPDNYPSKSYCHWNITTSSRITITFTDFDVESISGCLWDYVRVISEPFRNDSSLIPNYCGTLLPPSFTSYGRSMQVVFVSDRSVERRGFRLVYNTK